MLKGFTNKGELKNINVNEYGAIKVFSDAGSSSENPVIVKEKESVETTLYASLMILQPEEQTIGIGGKRITSIDIANYSDEENVTISIDEDNFVIGPGIATELIINKIVSMIGLSATNSNTKIQYIIKGVENV